MHAKYNTVKLAHNVEQTYKENSGLDLPVPDLYW